MKLAAIKADITKLEVDVIVNASNNAMMIGGGVDGAIHKAAGQELINYNAQFHGFGCQTGAVNLTPGFNLPAKHIFHTVGPDMRVYSQELADKLLANCYNECMLMAVAMNVKSIAFPSISTGIFGFDKVRAASIMISVMSRFNDNDIDVTLACFSDEDLKIISDSIACYDDEIHYISWSMYENTDDDDSDNWPLILNTDAPDGTYKVGHAWCENYGEAYGVVVKDGKFVVEPTLRAVAEARNQAGYWGTFLEDLIWNKKTGMFEACIGS